MSHLHVPDGVLPPIVWILGFVLAGLMLVWSAFASRRSGPQVVAYQSALGGIMLAVMALPIPITAFDYCMTLAGPVGVLLAPAAAFQVSFVVTLMLALLGQGGFTVVGLNALVLGLSAVAARPLYRATVAHWGPAPSMAFATAVSQLAASALWAVFLVLSIRLTPGVASEHEVEHTLLMVWRTAGVAVVVPMLLLAVAIEALLGFGLARFLARVRPALLPSVGGGDKAA